MRRYNEMHDLIEGYKRFRALGWLEKKATYEKLSEGQKPKALVIACIDSRVEPATIFDAGPGELLIVRNVANLVPPYAPDSAYHGTSAALEFGIRVLDIPNLIVLGHGQCGGVSALLNGAPEQAQDFVAPWMQIACAARTEAIKHPEEQRQLCCEREVIKISRDNLMSFPWIAERVADRRLTISCAWYAIKTGALEVLQDDDTFKAVE